MRVSKVRVCNFRGIKFSSILLPHHGVLIGDNNTGKSTIFEALDLTLGPDRLSRRSPINEHDFFKAAYFVEDEDKANPRIRIDVIVTHLDAEQARRFSPQLEWWNETHNKMVGAPLPAIEPDDVVPMVRVSFVGTYDEDDDDFTGETFFTNTLQEDEPKKFTKSDKRVCGFLYLRPVRTGSRALSLEHGSLLDIILRIKELRPKIWENIISSLESTEVAADPTVGITGVLQGIQESLSTYVPEDWGTAPRLRVSNLTREALRKVITAFVTDPLSGVSLPYYRQGTGTINMLVLSMLSMIAQGREGKVIFAMEEPETAIPPYSQKRIISEVRNLSSQALFTSHSPYVIEEFDVDETVLLHKKRNCKVDRKHIELPEKFDRKKYRKSFHQNVCEALLAKNVVVAEGETEVTALIACARRLSEINPAKYKSLEGLGVAVFDAGTETQILRFADFFNSLDKTIFAICDKQNENDSAAIESAVEQLFMHNRKSTELLIVKHSHDDAKRRYVEEVINNPKQWKPHLQKKFPDPLNEVDKVLRLYLTQNKGNWAVADFLSQCAEKEMPKFFRKTCRDLTRYFKPQPVPAILPGMEEE